MNDGTTRQKAKNYPECTLPATKLKPYTHLKHCAINEVFNRINEIVYILFKQKHKADEDMMLGMLKFFGVQIPKVNGQAIDLQEIKK